MSLLSSLFNFLFILFFFIKENNAISRAVMTVDRIEVIKKDSRYVDLNITCNKINRHDFGISANVSILDKIWDDALFSGEMLALYSNEYRRTPMNIVRPFCELLDHEYQWIQEGIRKCGNFPKHCPLSIGFYYFKDYVIDASKIPPLPWQKMKFVITIKLPGDKVIAVVDAYLTNNQEEVDILKKVT